MRAFHALAAVAALACLATAQRSLTTTFAPGGWFANVVPGGGATYFDVTVLQSVDIVALDLNCNTPGGGTLDVYVVRGTYLGNEANAAFWGNPVRAGEVFTAAPPGSPTHVPLSTPIALTPGSYTFALVNSLDSVFTALFGGTSRYADAYLQLDLGLVTRGSVPFVGPHGLGLWNGTVHYAPGSGGVPAGATTAGAGCGGSEGCFYELFDGSARRFDLFSPNPVTGFTLTWTGSGYAFTPGASPWSTPTGSNSLSMGDDSTVPVPLPFLLPCPQGAIPEVYLCSNGWLSFEPTTSTEFIESVSELLSEFTRLAFFWHDLDPTTSVGLGESIDAEADAAGVFHITFTNISEYGTAGNTVSVQVSLHRSGTIEVKYGTGSIGSSLVGLSSGHGASDPGGIDIGAATAFSFTAAPRLSLAVVDLPIIGTAPRVRVENLRRNTALAGAMNYGVPFRSPIDLTVFGAHSCLAYTAPMFSQAFSVAANWALVGIPIPNDPSLRGIRLDQQAAVADPTYNALGVAMSDVVIWTIGDH